MATFRPRYSDAAVKSLAVYQREGKPKEALPLLEKALPGSPQRAAAGNPDKLVTSSSRRVRAGAFDGVSQSREPAHAVPHHIHPISDAHTVERFVSAADHPINASDRFSR